MNDFWISTLDECNIYSYISSLNAFTTGFKKYSPLSVKTEVTCKDILCHLMSEQQVLLEKVKKNWKRPWTKHDKKMICR